ncbi:MAG TPA: hypothetical protein PL029_00045 [Bacteroidia bacterium]|nr:hypothetical protein [Bacteroidia bacterium]
MRAKLPFIPVVLFSVILITQCKTKEGPKVLPTVSTKEISKITDSSATLKCNTADEGSSALETVGVCWATFTGPTRLDSNRVSGPVKGDYEFDAAHLKNNTTYYVRAFATNKEGVTFGNELTFKTKPGWVYVTPSDNPYVTSIIAVNTTVLLGTFSGIYRADGSASNWTPSNSGLGSLKVNCLTRGGDDIYAGTEAGVFLSTNAGGSWSSVNNTLGNVIVNMLAANGETVCAGTTNGVYITTNRGVNWNKAVNYQGTSNVSMVAVLGNRIYAGSKTSREIYLSDNYGQSWTKMTKDFTNEAPSAIAAYPPQLVVATESGLYYSNDQGNTLEKVPGYDSPLYSVSYSDNALFAGGDAKVESLYFSTDHGTTFTLTENPGATTNYVTGLAKSGNYLYAVSGNKVYRMKL